MTEATCKREIELEIPAANVQKATEKVARDIARLARIPGFRPGKAPVTLVRRHFADDIQGEVVQSLVPEYLGKALDEKKLVPITRPEIDHVHFKEGEPLKFRAIFEVLPEFELGEYKNLPVQVDEIQVSDEQVDKALPYLEAAVRLDPKLLPARASLGLTYARAGKPAEAIPNLLAALETDEDGSLHYQLARAYQATGDAETAKKFLAKYRKFNNMPQRKRRIWKPKSRSRLRNREHLVGRDIL